MNDINNPDGVDKPDMDALFVELSTAQQAVVVEYIENGSKKSIDL